MPVQRIWKFPLFDLTQLSREEMAVSMPKHGRIVALNIVGMQLFLWVLFTDGDAQEVERRFIIRGTGHPIPLDATHIGTVLHGPFVWHLFEVP